MSDKGGSMIQFKCGIVRPLLTFHQDGSIVSDPEAKPDEAAVKILECIAQMYPSFVRKPGEAEDQKSNVIDILRRARWYVNEYVNLCRDAKIFIGPAELHSALISDIDQILCSQFTVTSPDTGGESE